MDEVIYAMIDPRDHLEFYVGRTQDIYKRFLQHIAYEKSNSAKHAKIQELKGLHLLPIMKTLEVVKNDSALAGEREAYWIRHFRHLGITLTNDVIYSTTYDQKGKPLTNKPPKWQSSSSDETKVVKQVRRMLRNNPKAKSSDIAIRVGISESYAQKLKARINKELKISISQFESAVSS